MGCCGKKTCDRPKEEMNSADALLGLLEDSSWVVAKLMEIAKTGVRSVGLKNDRLSELVDAISAIVAENTYLKSLLNNSSPDSLKITNNGANVLFGPRGEYSLFIPTPTQDARNKLAASLIAAGKELQQKKTVEYDPRQQQLPFES